MRIFNLVEIFHINLSFLELPKDARLDDLANLVNVDSVNIDVKQLGLDVMKEQHRINQKFSSDQCALIPEDKAQVMLTGVSIFIALECVIILSLQ